MCQGGEAVKCRILGLIRFLLVGAILNVLVAWTCTLLVEPIAKNATYGSEQVWSKPPMYLHAVLYAGFGSEALGTFYSTAFQPNTTLAFVPGWVDLPQQLAI